MIDSRRARELTKIAAGGISRRGPSALCEDSLWGLAVDLIHSVGSAAIVTGFFIPSAGAAETDGPAGSVTLARALLNLGLKAEIWTDSRCVRAISECAAAIGCPSDLTVDVSGDMDSVKLPELLIYIERLGRASDGAYYDMRKNDVSAFTSPLDEFALCGEAKVIGVGDGGNEAGMANYRRSLAAIMPDYAECLSAIASDVAVPVDVSNWGAYALCAALSIDAGRWLGHSAEEEIMMAEALLKAGAVDGVKRIPAASVDGFGMDKQLEIRAALRDLA